MSDDRDQLFEKALARHLRAAQPGDSACLDPETLAAYHERMLSPEELSAAKSHIVSCARCQEILAQLESTQEVEAKAETRVAAQALQGEIFEAAVPVRHLVRGSADVSTPQAKAKVATLPARKSLSSRWLMPAGAIAAGVLLLFGARGFLSPQHKAPVSQDVQVAQGDRPAAAPMYQVAPAPTEKQKTRSEANVRQDAVVAGELKKLQEQPASSGLHDLKSEARTAQKEAAAAPDKDAGSVGNLPARDQEKVARSRAYAPAPARPVPGPSAPSAQNQTVEALQRNEQKSELEGDTVNGEKNSAPSGSSEIVLSQPALDDSRSVAPKSGVAGGALAAKAAAPPPPPSPAAMKKSASGRLSGTVTDASGAAVSGASVMLKSPDGNSVATTSTDRSGTYSFDAVPAGNYQLELQSSGFKTDVLTGLNVASGQNVIDAKLEVGSAAETVAVTGAAVAANSTVETLPLNGRKVYELSRLSPGLQTISSSDGKSVWKFGEGGQIFHSTTAGESWISQASGVTGKLLAASAPNAKVCWIAGASGTLVRTTDGGKHWGRINVPIASDLGRIHAADAQHATIWDAVNHASYETSDGGLTWKQVAKEQR